MSAALYFITDDGVLSMQQVRLLQLQDSLIQNCISLICARGSLIRNGIRLIRSKDRPITSMKNIVLGNTENKKEGHPMDAPLVVFIEMRLY